jgi:hypothetical protein
VEKFCSDDILSPICDDFNDVCDPRSFKIPMKIAERAMNNCYLGDGTVHLGDHLLFIHELCELFKCAGESANFVSLRFSVLDNNIRDIKYVLSCAVLTDEEMPGQIFRPGVAG